MWAFLRLAVPMVVSRAGLAAMSIADGVMVARFDAREFASLSLADGTIGRLLDVGVALLIGALSLVPRHAAAGDDAGSRQLWVRFVPVALGLGVLGALAGWLGPVALAWMGQPAALVDGAGPVMLILGAGYPAALLAISAAVYLEGRNRPLQVAIAVVGANLLNIGLNWVLIGGHAGAPALGARGSALSTTVVRCALALVLVWIAVRLPGASSPPTTEAVGRERAASRRAQWRLGLGAAGSTAVMVTLGSSLTVFAGWLGVLPLATFAASWNLAAPIGLLALGMADAVGIQVASAAGRHGERGVGPVIRHGLGLSVSVVGVVAASLALGAGAVASVYTLDPSLRAGMTAVIPLVAFVAVVDGVAFVMATSLRALRDAAWPAAIEMGSMALVVPLAAALALTANQGVRGLFVAAAVVATVRTSLLVSRCWWRLRPVTTAVFAPGARAPVE